MYYCNFVNPPPVSKGEGPFPESIVDDRDAEPISSLVARMLRGELPPSQHEPLYDTEDDNANPDDFPSTLYDPTDLVSMDLDFPSGTSAVSKTPEATKEDLKPKTDQGNTDQPKAETKPKTDTGSEVKV